MKPERWQQIEHLYRSALARGAEEAEAFLAKACNGDEELLRQVELLLAQNRSESGFPGETETVATPHSPGDSASRDPGTEKFLGPYRLDRKLGEGGMGVVYAAYDERLGRTVALKRLRDAAPDAVARERMQREARIAASINHPSICQLHDIGQDRETTYLVMELLEGESLADRIQRGPLDLPSAIQVTLGILTGLDVLHRRNLVHRDLKPSNIFLTPHGVKLLDFGLARPVRFSRAGAAQDEAAVLTEVGSIVGTPNYMAPEVLLGQEPDARSDLFAVGAILFELLTGRRAFEAPNRSAVLNAVLTEQTPVLSGSAAISAADLIVRRALAKKPAERYQTTQAMSDDLRETLLRQDSGTSTQPRAVTRLIVLPFRILRADAEIDFLAYSLPDAITNSLAGLTSLIVRSGMTASRYAGTSPDLKLIAAEAEVDVVLSGTLLRSGDQLRMTTQLAEAPGGAVIWSQTSQASLKDIFQLQDDLVQRVVASLSLPLTARESRLLKHDVPASATAYEYYLRANQLGDDWDQMHLARDLYLKCVEHDPRYAPAWARLGRAYNRIAKYGGEEEDFARAEAAFQRALQLNPDLTLAHSLFAQLEATLGRAPDAMVRLLERTRANQNDPELYSGLVYACRSCGLLEASIAAHHRARRLDPLIPTSVTHSYFFSGDYARVLENSEGDIVGGVEALALCGLGRTQEAMAWFHDRERSENLQPFSRLYIVSERALLEGNYQESREAAEQTAAMTRRGGEELYYIARLMAQLGDTERALVELERTASLGFVCYPCMAKDPRLDPLRADPRFAEFLRKVHTRCEAARKMFIDAGGLQILGTA